MVCGWYLDCNDPKNSERLWLKKSANENCRPRAVAAIVTILEKNQLIIEILFLMNTDPKALVHRFYNEVWNQADEVVAKEILDSNFQFRGSLGSVKKGPDGFIEYMRSIHTALANYTCEIDHLVCSKDEAAARMTFHGQHQAEFFGVAATKRIINWSGAAFFHTNSGQITTLWVLGDIDSVKAQLGASETVNRFV